MIITRMEDPETAYFLTQINSNTMRKIYMLGFMTLASAYVLGQNCSNASSSACTSTITQNFNSSDGGFTGSNGFTYSSTNGNSV